MNKDEIKRDLLAFADDDSDILFDADGVVVFYKNGQEQICRFFTNSEGICMVEYLSETLPYRMFIAKHLARLDIFARRILEKRKKIDDFVDSPAILKTIRGEDHKTAIELLKQECDHFLEFGTKIIFVTADAGHGKSVLLKQFQYIQAERYSRGESNYIFWHVDLQGRDLVRLGEAIMYDLGELRLPGLYYPSIINLIQKRFMILAIDGFDELAAEIGGMKAISSLSYFVNEMASQGTLIAASRRTFFDVHDYLKKSSMLKATVPFEINFNEFKLQDWTKKEVITYFQKHGYEAPESFYEAILSEVHQAKHPVLTRPFLLAKVEASIQGDLDQISLFFSAKSNGNESVSYIVESFTRREVEKWKGVDNKTGKPYLTFDQHILLLSTIAKEMWNAKKDFVTIEEIEIYTVILFDEWKIDEELKQIIVRIVGSHAFLIPLSESMVNSRKFDHEEFKNYFLARALANLINTSLQKNNYTELNRFLYIDQLPDSVAMHCFNYVDNLHQNIQKIIDAFKSIINDEWKPTYLQLNIGTLVPFLINKIEFASPLRFDARVNYSSLVFENKNFKNVIFENGNFINISFKNSILDHVVFRKCEFNGIKIENNSDISFHEVLFEKCEVNYIIINNNGEVAEVAYSPKRIIDLLVQRGIKVVDGMEVEGEKNRKTQVELSEFKKALNKFLLKFGIMTIQYENNIVNDRYLGNNIDLIIDEIIPLCEQYKIIEPITTKVAKMNKSKAWHLIVNVEELFKYDGEDTDDHFALFWKCVNSK